MGKPGMWRIRGAVWAQGRIAPIPLAGIRRNGLIAAACRIGVPGRARRHVVTSRRCETLPANAALFNKSFKKTQERPFIYAFPNRFQWLGTIETWEARKWNWVLGVAAVLIFLSFLWTEVLRRRIRSQNILVQEWARREAALKTGMRNCSRMPMTSFTQRTSMGM